MLGNLSISQIENRLGIEFPDEIREFMKITHQSNANHIGKSQWHCFNIPFKIVCGDMEIATKIFESVKERSDECKEVLQFSLSGGQ